MRRKEKEIKDRETIDSILRKAEVCRLAMADGNEPYLVPMNFGYDGKALFFHSSPEGRKIAILRKNDRVWFEVEGACRLSPKGEEACAWGMEYEAVMGSGRAVFLEEDGAKLQALEVIMDHYAPGKRFTYSPGALKKVLAFRVDIETISGKRSPAS